MFRIALVSLLFASVLATPAPEADGVFARQNRNWNKKGFDNNCPAKREYNCLIDNGGAPFISSYCSSAVPAKKTITVTSTGFVTATAFATTVTAITASTFVTGSPVVTTVDATATSTILLPVTSTSYASTTTIQVTVSTPVTDATFTTTEFGCPPSTLTSTSLSFPAVSSVSSVSVLRIEEPSAFPIEQPSILPAFDPEVPPPGKRQAVFPVRDCQAAWGSEGLKRACGCTKLPLPTTTVGITQTTTAQGVTTVGIETLTITPTITSFITATVDFNSTETTVTDGGVFTETVNVTVPASSFTYAATTTTTVVPPIPTDFKLSIEGLSGNSLPALALISLEIDRPGSNGTLIVPSYAADGGSVFSIDSLARLTDLQGGFVEKNARNPYPYLFLTPISDPISVNVPVCEFNCNLTVSCDYPGTTGNNFALCNNFLALGQNLGTPQVPEAPTSDPCTRVELRASGYRGLIEPSLTSSSALVEPTTLA